MQHVQLIEARADRPAYIDFSAIMAIGTPAHEDRARTRRIIPSDYSRMCTRARMRGTPAILIKARAFR
jgi:hypothetical protein